MFQIHNCDVYVYSCTKKISIISARIADQPYETLLAMGRGTMYKTSSGSRLRYDFPGDVMVALSTE